MVLFCDGAARGNQTANPKSGCGWLLKEGTETIVTGYEYLGIGKTNNEAEYMGLINGLRYAVATNSKVNMVFMDSNLVVQQMLGNYRVKADNLKPLYSIAKKLMDQLGTKIMYIPREKNSEADALANRAIDEAIK